jgi:FlaA1/EpsC-like NDP-sugar epimerase
MSPVRVWWLRRRRDLLFLLSDAALILLALYGSFWLRFDGEIPERWLSQLPLYAAIALAGKIPVFAAFRLYRISWAYVSFPELTRVFLAVSLSSSLLGTLYFLLDREQVIEALPRSVLILDYAFTLLFIGALRSAKRIHRGLMRQGRPQTGRRTLLVGAGDAGEQILRAIQQMAQSPYLPIGFVDDDPAKQGLSLHGARVLGCRADIPELAHRYQVEELLITMPSAAGPVIRETVELGRKAGLKRIRILPGLHELASGRLSLTDLREVQLEDLLGREPVHIDTQEIEGYLHEKRVLITGAAGSIGSELCRQVAKFAPSALLILDRDESGLFDLEDELRERFPDLKVSVVIADVGDSAKIYGIFQYHQPEIVFHAAAYKHVPLMEAYPEEAVKTNVLGTRIVAEAALSAGGEKLVRQGREPHLGDGCH